jgi:signal transduction histidine kinase
MFTRLHFKLITIFLGLLMVSSIAIQVINHFSTRMCLREIHQSLNRDLAANLADQWYESEGPVLRAGRINTVFQPILSINGNIAIFLLDGEGRIVCGSAPLESLARKEVDIKPIDRFLSPITGYPITGINPLNGEKDSIFSAAPIMNENQKIGYMYVILESEPSRTVTALLDQSNVFWQNLTAVSAGLLIVFVLGGVFLSRSTRRLRLLADGLEEYQNSSFLRPSAIVITAKEGREDEIDRLSRVTRGMAEKITGQFSELKQASEFRHALVTNVSHNLRTPLASLLGYLESAQIKGESLPPEDLRTYLKTALSNARKLNMILEDFSELSRMNSADFSLALENFSVAELLSDLVDKYNAKDHRCYIVNSDQIITRIQGDVRLLNLAFEKILDILFLPTTGLASVRVDILEDEAGVLIRFNETEHALSEDTLSHFLSPYGTESGTTGSKGNGFGLVISRDIIRAHGGSLAIESAGSSGTTLVVALPR